MEDKELRKLIIKKTETQKSIMHCLIFACICFGGYMFYHFAKPPILEGIEFGFYIFTLVDLIFFWLVMKNSYKRMRRMQEWEIVIQETSLYEYFQGLDETQIKILAEFLPSGAEEIENYGEKVFAVYLKEPKTFSLDLVAFFKKEELKNVEKYML